MTTQLVLIAGLAVSFFVALFLSRREGSKAAQLEALKKELEKNAKEQERISKINASVASMSADDARRKLCELQANKQQKRVR